MSRSPYFFVERYDRHTNKYELQHPIVWNWDHTKQEAADLFPYNGCHDLFSIVEDNGYGDLPEMKGIHNGLPKDVCEEIQKEYNKHTYDENWGGEKTYHYEPHARWFTYADMYIYYLEHPLSLDYDAMDRAYEYAEEGKEVEKIMRDNPILSLKNRIDAFLEVCDGWDWKNDYSQIRIVYWIN